MALIVGMALAIVTGAPVGQLSYIPGRAAIARTDVRPPPANPALTPMRSWTPSPFAEQFKRAVVCHDNTRDVYGITAVFRVRAPNPFPWRWMPGDAMVGKSPAYVHYSRATRHSYSRHSIHDELFYLLVDGDSSSPTYGEITKFLYIESVPSIDNIDCAHDGDQNIFVAFDRKNANARWYRIDGDAVHGPYAITGCTPHSHRPRISFARAPDAALIAAFDGYYYQGLGNSPAPFESCEVCVQAFNAYTGTTKGGGFIWPENMTHEGYDIEWNGSDRFVLALSMWIDAGAGPLLVTYSFDNNGASFEPSVAGMGELIQDFRAEPNPGYPSKVRLVFSDDVQSNPDKMLFLQTSERSSYWLTQDGRHHGDPFFKPHSFSPAFATCEYRGARNFLAHTFTGDFSPLFLNPSTPRTLHMHWSPAPDWPNDLYAAAYGHFPEACSSSGTRDDAEILLVSSPPTGGPAVYWQIWPQD